MFCHETLRNACSVSHCLLLHWGQRRACQPWFKCKFSIFCQNKLLQYDYCMFMRFRGDDVGHKPSEATQCLCDTTREVDAALWVFVLLRTLCTLLARNGSSALWIRCKVWLDLQQWDTLQVLARCPQTRRIPPGLTRCLLIGLHSTPPVCCVDICSQSCHPVSDLSALTMRVVVDSRVTPPQHDFLTSFCSSPIAFPNYRK